MKTFLVLLAAIAVVANAQCYTFYTGLCPGPSNCLCTLYESCGGERNASKARSASGDCSGDCRFVNYGQCPGDSSCLQDAGSCSQPPPPPGPPGPSGQYLGGDVSDYVSSSQFSCAVSAGWSFMIVRSYCSYGAPDSNALPTIQAAKAGGISTTDVYHFPCIGVDAAQQMRDDVNGVGAGNFNRLWFDIETNPSSGCGWQDPSANCNFLSDMISEGQSLGIQMGVYASSYMWSSIMGDGCTVGADAGLPVWYAHYDGSRSFSDFTPFGGWDSPTAKQYSDSSSIASGCGFSADADFA